jgi:hypothetical protein
MSDLPTPATKRATVTGGIRGYAGIRILYGAAQLSTSR